jgi:hypothetical protein
MMARYASFTVGGVSVSGTEISRAPAPQSCPPRGGPLKQRRR